MKIGIITFFHKSTNYGGVLQAYALCKYLNDHGYKASQIKYIPKVSKISTAYATPTELWRKIVGRIERKLYQKKDLQIKNRMEGLFGPFRESIPHTKREYTKDNIKELETEFDVFVAGSDQIWNPIWHDSSYMLSFVGEKNIKLSYAASMGLSVLDKEQEKIFKKYLSDFKGISVREKAAEEALSPILNKDVNVSVDPTLLLTTEDWDKLATDRKINDKYVFLYFLGDDINARKAAEKFVKIKGLKAVMIPDLLGTYRKNDRKIEAERILDATPEDFISLIKYAEYVITDSFHACVFSLLYHKEFFVFKRTGSMEMGSRIQNLTALFDCEERFCIGKKEMETKYLLSLPTLDYEKTFELFLKEKQKSMDYLDRNL